MASSAFLQVVFENVTTMILSELELEFGLEEEVKNLTDYLSLIKAFLKDAEEKRQTDDAVKKWLEQLGDVAYDANDLLDEFATEAQHRRLIRFSKVRNSLSLASPHRVIFRHEISHSIKEIQKRLDEIQKRKNSLGLTVRERAGHREENSRDFQLLQTSSLNSLSFLPLGREDDKQRVIELLLSSNGAGDAGISVLPVYGMAGLGKTTLAKLVYNDEFVESYFGLRLWIHVSRDFDVNKITKAIIEAIDSSGFDQMSLDSLHKNLRARLGGRKYLLVLDDVWNENPLAWESLRTPLLYGGKGSKILLTTRSLEVSKVMGTVAPYKLKGLGDDDCWSLFCQCALGPNPSTGSDLDNIASEVLNKCRGLPLAAQSIGFRLRRETDRSRWGDIIREETYEFSGGDNDLLCSVRLSYQHLPADLKPCFAYCSIIPRGYVFDKEFLVQLWMAQNFLLPRGDERLEDLGGRYFDSLVERSFFQHYRSNNQDKFMMHNVIHDLARSVSGPECCVVETGRSVSALDKTRHCTLIYGPSDPMGSRKSSPSNIFERIYGCKGLYTLLAIGASAEYGVEIAEEDVKQLRCLRALYLSNSRISQIPKSIGELQHLRYLQLSNTNIKTLPDSVGRLYNLQTLGLANCYALEELPKDTRYLCKLRHLDLRLDTGSATMFDGGNSWRWGSLRSMPPKIGKLTHLQTLPRFVVGTEKRCGLSELENLNNLHGKLRISNLHNVLNASEAKNASLTTKTRLQSLELWWRDCVYSTSKLFSHRNEEEVLRMLQPHTKLKELKIVGYNGASFPPWVGQPSFSNIATLALYDCKKCEVLPPLGQLPFLKELYVKGMDGVVCVDCAFCGPGPNGFPSLEKLHFERMKKFQVWCGDETCELPRLRELVFKDCTDLRQLTHKFSSLSKLVIEGSPWFLGLPKIPSLRSLDVKAKSEWIWESPLLLTSLSSLTISYSTIKNVPPRRGAAPSLRRVEISHCDELESLPGDWLPAGLTYFAIRHCPRLRVLPAGLRDHGALEDMEIEDCMQLQSLPDQLPRALQYLSIYNCPQLTQYCQGRDWSQIAHVWIDKKLLINPGRP